MRSSDDLILDLLRKREVMSVAELVAALGVTATAVRQRLKRLLDQQLVLCDKESTLKTSGRGRPTHRYSLSAAGRRQCGENFADLAVALWQELRLVQDVEVRRGLIERISKRLAITYRGQIRGTTMTERMESLGQLFSDRKIPFDVDTSGDLPVLIARACPYPDLVEQDRAICAMERLLFTEVLGDAVHLTNCRLDGTSCCTFELN